MPLVLKLILPKLHLVIKIRKSLSRPYQGLYIDFGFPGCITKDKDGKMKESSHVDIEGLNGEQAWILISVGKTCMLLGDTTLAKASPLKYLESFPSEYAPEYKDKWVILDQGSKLYDNAKIKNLFRRIGYKIYPTNHDSLFQNGLVKRKEHTESFHKALKLY